MKWEDDDEEEEEEKDDLARHPLKQYKPRKSDYLLRRLEKI